MEISQTGTKSRNKRYCVVPTCFKERFDLVHKFPMEDYRTKQWLNAINVKHLWNIPLEKLRTSYFVCSRHFRNEDYKNPISRSINKTAIPSLNLLNLNDDNHLQRYKPKLPDPLNINQIVKISNIITPTENIVEENEIKCYRKHKIKPSSIDDDGDNLKFDDDDNQKFKLIRKSIEIKDDEIINEVNITELDIYDENGCSLEQINETNFICEEDMSTLLEISHPEYPETTNLNYFWLRDHCKCKICYNINTHQRNYNILDISLDIKPNIVDAKIDKLYVTWNDNHESEYEYDFLFKNSKQNINLISTNPNDEFIQQILWDKQKIIDDQFKYAKIDFGNFLKNDNLAKDVMKSLLQYGFAFIENVPPTTDMTEMTIRRLFPIQKTFFGEMWTFSDKIPEHADFAYTNKFLLSHNDNTYFNDPAGLITFHCIKNNCNGGETILVDGFKILNDFKLKYPISYELLCNINVPSEYIEDGQYHKYSAPIIKLNLITNQPEQIRYNLYDRSILNTLSQNDIGNFYKALNELTNLIQSNENELRFKLNPGTVVIFDNWRLLHGREKYNGLRIVTGCYIQRTDYLSKARIYGLIS